MLGVGRIRGDLGIAACRLEALLGQRRVVVGVDQVVGDARMVGLFSVQRLQDRRRPHLVGIGPIRRVEVGRRHQGMQDRSLEVVRVAGRDPSQCLLERLDPGAMVDAVVVAHERFHRRHVALLALVVEPCRARFLERFGHGVEPFRRQAAGPEERVVEHDHRTAPMGHAASGVARRDPGEGGSRFRPRERVIERHGAIEALLCRGTAANGEVDRPEPSQVMAMLIVLGGSGSAEAQAAGCTEDDEPRPCTCESSVHDVFPPNLCVVGER